MLVSQVHHTNELRDNCSNRPNLVPQPVITKVFGPSLRNHNQQRLSQASQFVGALFETVTAFGWVKAPEREKLAGDVIYFALHVQQTWGGLYRVLIWSRELILMQPLFHNNRRVVHRIAPFRSAVSGKTTAACMNNDRATAASQQLGRATGRVCKY